MGVVVTKVTQNLLLILVGAAVLWITVATDEYLNYVKPGFRFLLVAAAVALIALGSVGVRKEGREAARPLTGQKDEHGHDHGRGPRVAWLLCLPAFTIFLIAPPALGSFTASRGTARSAVPARQPDEGFGPLKSRSGGAPVEMTLGEFIGRSFEAQTGDPSRLKGFPVKLTGFATPRTKGGWYLSRLRMACCAGDAIALRVMVQNAPAPRPDAWVQVIGTWMPPTTGTVSTGVHELSASTVQPIKKPRNPYES
ncbi:MAG: hypothetical protein JWO67_5142 [Streptosporangiaceae bacterium]|nr:hypothetical protein [Streptosporangiaceae bacterium]